MKLIINKGTIQLWSIFFTLLISGCGSDLKKPNVLFILADDFGYHDMSCMGSTFYETPNLDRIASEGSIFTDGYATCQVCSPSRASIMSGKFPARHGITNFIGAPAGEQWRKKNRFSKLIPPEYARQLDTSYTTLPEAMKEAGYKTFFAGKWHLGPEGSWPEDHGFDINKGGWDSGGPRGGYFSPFSNPRLENREEGENLSLRLARETVKFIKENNPEKTGKPFFAYLAFYAVHSPIQTTQEKWKKYRDKAEMQGIAENAFIMGKYLPIRQVQDNPVYAGLVEQMDDAIGEVLSTLDELGLEKNTIVVFTSDNGGVAAGDNFSTSNRPLRAGKGYQYEGGIREPYFIKVPGLSKGGELIHYPVSGTDFYPTLLELAGEEARPDEHQDGVSLVPLLQGETLPERALIWHYPHYGNQGGEPSSIIRRGDWKLIHYYEDGRKELYNLAEDISETSDLAAEHPERVEQLGKELFDFLTSVGTNYPHADPEYDEAKENELLYRTEHVKMPSLERQRMKFLSEDFDPGNRWWGSMASPVLNAREIVRSPDGRIEVQLLDNNGLLSYSVSLNGEAIIGPSDLGLKSNEADTLKIIEVSRSSADKSWEAVWGTQKTHHDHYNAIHLKIGGKSAQTIMFRAYNDGVAFRYRIPDDRVFREEAYAHEASAVSFLSEKPMAWFPLSSTQVSEAVEINSWKSTHALKPSGIGTPFTLKLSDRAYISLHEAAVVHSDDAGLRLTENTLTYISNPETAGGSITPWRTLTIADCPGGLIESSLLVNLNEPSRIKDTGWIRPGKSMWDWRNHGAHADDGFEYGLSTESYFRYIDFAAEHGVEYVLIDAEWYGPERDPKSDPKIHLPRIDIPKICAHAKTRGVGIWLYVNTTGLEHYDLDETLSLYRKWGVAGIKHGFLSGASRKHIEFSHQVAKKCAGYQIQYTVHEPYKPSGYHRTYPNILSYEYVNSMLDGPTRPSATPGRLINLLFVHALAGPVDRSCGMFDLDDFITREKCHRQLPSTVVSQTAQCLLFPSGLLTLPDHPDAYKRKADLFEFISHLPMTWDETRVLDTEIGQYITLARKAGDQWFVGALANEEGRTSTLSLDFLDPGTAYDVTLYEDAPDAHYEFIGPANKQEARESKQEMKPHRTQRELYQVKKITARKGDSIPVYIAPGGGHCMWIRPVPQTK